MKKSIKISIVFLISVISVGFIIFLINSLYFENTLIYLSLNEPINEKQALNIAKQTKEAKLILEQYKSDVEVTAQLVYVTKFLPELENYKEWVVRFYVPEKSILVTVNIYLNGSINSVYSNNL